MNRAPREHRDIRKMAFELRQFLTDAERSELDRLLLSPPKERARYKNDPVSFAKEVLKVDLAPYQEQVLEALAKYRRVCVCGPHGLGKCVWHNDHMRLADGSLVPAHELIGTEFDVLAVDENMNVGVYRAYAVDNGYKTVVRITTDKGRTITRTHNHPVWADTSPYKYNSREGRDRLMPIGGWVDMERLTPGSVIAAYLGNEGASGVDISDDAIKVLAYLIGDGGLTGGSVRFSNADPVVINDFVSACERLGSSVRYVSQYDFVVQSGTKYTRGRGANPVKDLVEDTGLWEHGSYSKRFPSMFWNFDNRQMSLFLSRLYACDGWACVSERKDRSWSLRQIGYATVNRDLADDVNRALLRLGIHASINVRKASIQDGVTVTSYTVQLGDAENMLAFAERVGIFSKEDAIEEVVASCRSASELKTQKWRRTNLPDHMRWERVETVEVIDDEPTVAITVPGPHTFLTDFVEHNTTTSSIAILWFISTRDECKIPTTASAWRQLIEFLWPEIHKWALRGEWWRIGEQIRPGKELLAQRLVLGPNRFAFAIASNDEAKIEGVHSDSVLYLFDEAKTIPPAIWDAAEGAMSIGDAYALACSTPGESTGRFYDIMNKKPGFEDWHVVHVKMDDVIAAGRMSKDWAEARARAWGEQSVMYRRRVRGEFAEDSGDTLIMLSQVEAAQERWRDIQFQIATLIGTGVDAQEALEQVIGPMTHLGVDPARLGNDKTGWAHRHGSTILKIGRTDKEDTMETAGRAFAFLQGNTAVAHIDVNGLGAGVYDRLKELWEEGKLRTPKGKVPPLIPINVSNGTRQTDRTKQHSFSRLRDFLWWNVRELLENNEIALPPDDEMARDLVSPSWTITSSGKILIESKDDIRKKLGRSPDVGDAVILAYSPDTPAYSLKIGFV